MHVIPLTAWLKAHFLYFVSLIIFHNFVTEIGFSEMRVISEMTFGALSCRLIRSGENFLWNSSVTSKCISYSHSITLISHFSTFRVKCIQLASVFESNEFSKCEIAVSRLFKKFLQKNDFTDCFSTKTFLKIHSKNLITDLCEKLEHGKWLRVHDLKEISRREQCFWENHRRKLTSNGAIFC